MAPAVMAAFGDALAVMDEQRDGYMYTNVVERRDELAELRRRLAA
jgi:hypothetical protein